MGCACLQNRIIDLNGETNENKEIEEDPYNNNNNNVNYKSDDPKSNSGNENAKK